MLDRRATLALLLLAACGDSKGDTTDTSPLTTTGVATDPDTTASPGTSGEAPTSTGEAPTTAGDTSTGDATTGALEDLDMQPEDFTCILEWDKVRKFRMTNLLGHQDEALAVANNPDGGDYPVGTVIQLIPNEAMVKRAAGFAPDNDDWEFFFLDTTVDGTTIVDRGATNAVVNGFGANCFDCHAKAMPQWDRICEEGHGCDPLPFTAEQIEMVQQSDPRCP